MRLMDWPRFVVFLCFFNLGCCISLASDESTVLYYTFDETGTILDHSGSGFHPTPSSSPVPTLTGSTVSLSTGAHLTAPTINFKAGPVSVVVRFKIDLTSSGTYARVIDFGAGAPNGNVIMGRYGTGSKCIFHVYQGTSNKVLEIDSMLETNTWMHFVVTMSSAGSVMYKNGAQVGSSTDAWDMAASTLTSNYLFKSNFGGDGAFVGEADYVAVLTRVVTASEAAELFFRSATAFNFALDSNLFMHYKFDETDGTVLDHSTNGLHGTPIVGVQLTFTGSTVIVPYGAYVVLPTVTMGTTDLTIAARFKMNTAASRNYARLIDLGSGAQTGNIVLDRNLTTDSMGAQIFQGTTSKDLFTSITSDTWTHIVVTTSATHMRIYKDGLLAGTRTGWQTLGATHTTNFLFKSNWVTTPAGFVGEVDFIAVLTTALTAENVGAMYQEFLDNNHDASVMGDPIFSTFSGSSHQMHLYPGLFVLLSHPELTVTAVLEQLPSLPEGEDVVMVMVGVSVKEANGTLYLYCVAPTQMDDTEQELCQGKSPRALSLISAQSPNSVSMKLNAFDITVEFKAVHGAAWMHGEMEVYPMSYYLDLKLRGNPTATQRSVLGGLLGDLQHCPISVVRERIALRDYESLNGDPFPFL